MNTFGNSGDRLEWSSIKDRIDCAKVATALLGPAPGRRGERGRKLWWRCPFHPDENPSFCVEPGKPWWKCWGCSEHGDAAGLVMKLRGVPFPEASRITAELSDLALSLSSKKYISPGTPGIQAPEGQELTGYRGGEFLTFLDLGRAKHSSPPPEEAFGLPLDDAKSLVDNALERLWTPEGAKALAYLREHRGLDDETIRAARLGWTPKVRIPTRDGDRSFTAQGVVIPWHDGDRLALVKIRQPEGTRPKYAEAYRDRPRVYPGTEAIEPGRPLVVVEGEFDALLLGQEIGHASPVITFGSASMRLDPATQSELLAASPWYIATDADPAGDKAAAGWPARAIRVRPPESAKDWTEMHAKGFNRLRYIWGRYLVLAIPWETLETQRWGPALGEPMEGPDPYALAERLAIQQETDP